MTDDVWIYVESTGGEPENIGFEMLGKGRELADELGADVTALLAGAPDTLGDAADATLARGADRALVLEHDLLESYRPETYADAVEQVVRDGSPGALLVGATNNGIDLAGRLAVRLDAGLTADVTRLELDDDGEPVGGVPAFAGGILAMVKATGNLPHMTTVRPGVFEALEPGDPGGTVEHREPDLSAEDVVTEVLDRSVGESVDLPSADVVVAAGRGFDGDVELAEELAEALDATVGVTRPLCDEGLVSRDRQIGTTGYSLKADLCVVAGVSGAVHFTAGIEDCDTVIAVNTDPEEPIFDHADYCVEGDLHEVLPALLDELEGREVAT
jgi:electron transfer flavoprotein alpha subunit